MKLRFRKNTLRLRLNQKEVGLLSAGTALREELRFPGNSSITYLLEPFGQGTATATFVDGVIRIGAPGLAIRDWAESEAIGLYYQLAADGGALHVAIEKDLECLDSPEEERDPDSFARVGQSAC